jgi:hypothetical protein
VQTWRSHFRVLFSSSILTFLGRGLLAFVLRKQQPVLCNPLSLVLFVVIYSIFEFWNKISDWCHKFSFIVAFFEGLGQFKLFTLCLRNIGGSNPSWVLFFSLIFGTYDILIQWPARAFTGVKTLPFTWFKYWVQALVTFVVYWLVTRENAVTKVIGVKDVIPCAVVFGIFHGIANAYFGLSAKRKEKPVSTEKALKTV